MAETMSTYATLDEWVAREARPFALDDADNFEVAVDHLIAALGNDVAVLALGEGMHGGVDLLRLRNRLFQRLVVAHGYSAIALESSFPRGRLVNDYAAGRGSDNYGAVAESGFSHGFGKLTANRELVEWIRAYNADPAHNVPLHVYGFDGATEMWGSDSPRLLLAFVLDYFATLDAARARVYRQRIEPLLGADAAWENPTATMDPAQYIGGSPATAALRLETEALLTELRLHRPEQTTLADAGRLMEAEHYAEQTRQLLTYHAEMAHPSGDRTARLLGLRDLMMANNLAYIIGQEQAQGRGKVLAFAHNSHVQRGEAAWQLGTISVRWWPAGAHLEEMFGHRYAVIGTGVGAAVAHGLGQPEAGTLEARLTAAPGPGRFVPTHRGQGLSTTEVAALPTRSDSQQNKSYVALAPRSLSDFDWLAVLDTTA